MLRNACRLRKKCATNAHFSKKAGTWDSYNYFTSANSADHEEHLAMQQESESAVLPGSFPLQHGRRPLTPKLVWAAAAHSRSAGSLIVTA
jgi:hypothetical protein